MEEFIVVVEISVIAESFEKALSKVDSSLTDNDVVDGKEIVNFWINEDFSESINGLDASDDIEDEDDDDDEDGWDNEDLDEDGK